MYASGSIFGEYRLEQLIFSGPLAQLWMGVHVARNERVALKLLSPGVFTPAARDQAFERLAAITAAVGRLEHPALQTPLDAVRTAEGFGLSARWIDGVPFGLGADPSRPEVLDEVLRLLAGLAELLGWLHLRGLAHGNIKANNVLVAPARKPPLVLLDLVWTRAILGSGASAQLPEGGAPSPAGDQWLAAMLLHGVLTAGTKGKAEALASAPKPVLILLKRALAPQPEARFPNLPAFAAALEQARQTLSNQTHAREIARSSAVVPHEKVAFGEAGALEPPTEAIDLRTLAAPQRTHELLVEHPSLIETPSLGARPESVDSRKVLEEAAIPAHEPTTVLPPLASRDGPPWRLLGSVLMVLAAVIAGTATSLYSERVAALEDSQLLLSQSAQHARDFVHTETPTSSQEHRALDPSELPASAEPPKVGEPTPDSWPEGDAAPRAPSSENSDPDPLNEACDHGGAEACMRLGERGATRAFERACRLGATRGCLEGALRLESRAGGEKRARILYERACDARLADGCARLASLWASGRGGPQNDRTAESFRRRACLLGHTQSCDTRQ